MDYAEARAAFFTPREGPTPTPRWSTPARRLRDAVEPIATVCFWSEPAYDAWASRGLDFLQGYVWSRSSALGNAEPTVAAAAFGVFEPGLVTGVLDEARQRCDLAGIRAARVEGAGAALREVLGDPAEAEGLRETTDALRSAVATSPLLGRPFFAGLSAVAWPDDPWVALWHACSLARELRGDAHLAALVAAGLDGVEANLLTERWIGWEPLAYAGSRAWSAEQLEAATEALVARGLLDGDGLSAAGLALREELETRTDAAVQHLVDGLETGPGGLAAVVDRLEGWADLVVASGWFPPDPLKRAAG